MNNFLGVIITILNQLNLAIISVFSNDETVSFHSVPIKESVQKWLQSLKILWRDYVKLFCSSFARY